MWTKKTIGVLPDMTTIDECLSNAYLSSQAQFAVWNGEVCFLGRLDETNGEETPVVQGVDVVYVKNEGERVEITHPSSHHTSKTVSFLIRQFLCLAFRLSRVKLQKILY